ncbi:MAG TPA: hypothetical protein VHB98_04975, partial [Chloroflexota bacterium]|nr:hypothetical protein [Chloroflexota bacterium]
PVVASELLATKTAQPSFYLGSANAGQSWIVMGSNTGAGSSQTLSVLNPNSTSCTVTFSVVHGTSTGSTWRIRLPAYGRIARIVDGLVPADGGIITVQASEPVAVGRTLESNSGAATSTGMVATDNAG